jgi:hypothetical protein
MGEGIMNGWMFKEVIEVVCKTKNVPKRKLCTHLGISQPQMSSYERNGVPIQLKPLIMQRLKNFLFDVA